MSTRMKSTVYTAEAKFTGLVPWLPPVPAKPDAEGIRAASTPCHSPSRVTSPGPRRETLTVEETATILGIGRSAAFEACRTGAIPSIRIGRRLVVPRLALDRLLSGETG
jgi:excisionase family DNA binding protein